MSANAIVDGSAGHESIGLSYWRWVRRMRKDTPSSSLLDSSDLVSRERLLEGVE